MELAVPARLADLRDHLEQFLDNRVRPAEQYLATAEEKSRRNKLAQLQGAAREHGLWGLAYPAAFGGASLPLADYAYLAELEGKYPYADAVLGSDVLLDVVMLDRHATAQIRELFLKPLVAGQAVPCHGMTEPGITGSDIGQLRTTAKRDGDEWVIRGRKWFCRAARADFITVMCRTAGLGTPNRRAFSLFVVPTDTPGFRVVRGVRVLGLEDDHCEVEFNDVRVPAEWMLGNVGEGFVLAQQRLNLGRTLRCLQWLGQAQRAFELMCQRLNQRWVFNELLADKQLMQQHVFESHVQIQAARALVLHAAAALDAPADRDAAAEASTAKVVASRMFCTVTDRAVQVFGAEGLTDDTPLSRLFRIARSTRIYDGPEELHVQLVGRHLLRKDPRVTAAPSEADRGTHQGTAEPRTPRSAVAHTA